MCVLIAKPGRVALNKFGIKKENREGEIVRVGFYSAGSGDFVLLEADKFIYNKDQGFVRVFARDEVWGADGLKKLGVYQRDFETGFIMLPSLRLIEKAGD